MVGSVAFVPLGAAPLRQAVTGAIGRAPLYGFSLRAGAGDAIVDPGAPVQMMTQVATEGATDAVQIGGYSIIQADSVEDAMAVLSSHPYVARGGTLQVNKILDV